MNDAHHTLQYHSNQMTLSLEIAGGCFLYATEPLYCTYLKQLTHIQPRLHIITVINCAGLVAKWKTNAGLRLP